MTLTELQDYYAKQLIAQYRGKPKASDTIRMIANLSLCDGLIQEEIECFDLDTAIGEQLTILGRIVGVPRNVIGLDLAHTAWAYRRYNSPYGGQNFLRYADTPDPTFIFSRYQSNATYTLSDFELRTLIKIKIIYNNVYESYKDMVDAFWAIFGSAISIVDNKDMTVSYTATSGYATVMTVAEFLNIIPRPMGVAADVTIV
jgi:hypothetical protein